MGKTCFLEIGLIGGELKSIGALATTIIKTLNNAIKIRAIKTSFIFKLKLIVFQKRFYLYGNLGKCTLILITVKVLFNVFLK